MFSFRKKLVGIDVSDRSIELLQLNKKKQVLSYSRIVLQKGIVENGKVLDKQAFTESLKELLKKTKPKQFQDSDKIQAVLNIPESKSFLGEPATMPWQEHEVYQANLNNLLVAVPKYIIDDYLSASRKAGIEAIALELEALSLGRALLGGQKKIAIFDKMILDIGSRTTNMSIFNKKGKLMMCVLIPIGGNHFTSDIMRSLKVKKDQAKELKANFGFDQTKTDNKVLSVLQAGMQKIVEQAKLAIIDYESKYNSPIKEIILTGGSALLPALDKYLEVNLARKVFLGDPFQNIKTFDFLKKTRKNMAVFGSVIGLALRAVNKEVKTINLLPSALLKQKKKKVKPKHKQKDKQKTNWRQLFSRRLLFLVIIVVILGIFIAYWFLFIRQSENEEDTITGIPSSTSSDDLLDPDIFLVPDQVDLSTSTDLLDSEQSDKIDIEESEKVIILDTPTGWLNVRNGPGTNFEQITRVYPGDEFVLLEENNNWYKIELSEDEQGWIFANYAQKVD